jgi:hypothetical protein
MLLYHRTHAADDILRVRRHAARRARISRRRRAKATTPVQAKMSEDGSGTGVSASLEQEKKMPSPAIFILGADG